MEWKRVLCNWRSIALLLSLLLINGVVYRDYMRNHSDDYMMEQDEYRKYIQEFSERVSDVIENGRKMEQFSIFTGGDAFAGENIKQTVDDFSRVKGVTPVLLEHPDIASLFSFKLVHFCVFAYGLWMVLLFVAEKKKGLGMILHTCRNGRGRMFITRFLILVTGMTGCCFLLYLSMIIMLAVRSGIPSLMVPVQSVPMLGEVTIPCSILRFMLIAFLLQTAGSIMTVMAVWFIVSCVRNLSVGVWISAILLGMEYILCSSVSIQSSLCPLRYMNLYFSLDLSELADRYYNVRLGSMAVPAVRLFLYFCVGFMVVLFFGLFMVAVKRYPVSAKGMIEKWLEARMAALRRIMAGLPVLIWELYKILWCQKGIVIFVLFLCLLMGTLDDSPMLFTAEQEYLNAFYETKSGPVTEEVIEEMEQDVMLQEQLAFIKEKREEGWDGIWLVNERGYEVLVGTEGDSRRNRDSALACLCILLILSGSMVYERKRDMRPLLHSGSRSSAWLFRRKYIAADLIVLGIAIVMFGIQWKCVSIHYTLDCLHAPVQSLPFLSEIHLPVSLGVYMLFLAVGELIILHTYKNLVLCLSVICPNLYLVILAGILCLIPNVWMEMRIMQGVFTDTAIFVRCGEILFLILINAVLYRVGVTEWRKRCW